MKDATQLWRERISDGIDLRTDRDDPDYAQKHDKTMALLDPIFRHAPPVWDHASLAFYYEHFPDGLRTLWLTSVLEGDVMNGGFDCYLGGVSGDFAPQTLDALKTLGAPEHTRVLDNAIRLFGVPFPNTETSRNNLFDNDPELARRLEALDAAYNDAYESESLHDLWHAHVKEHPDEFFR